MTICSLLCELDVWMSVARYFSLNRVDGIENALPRLVCVALHGSQPSAELTKRWMTDKAAKRFWIKLWKLAKAEKLKRWCIGYGLKVTEALHRREIDGA